MERLSIRDAVAKWNASTQSANVTVNVPEDGSCCWMDCADTATSETLIGLRLCTAHFSRFYSPEPANLKIGVMRIG